MTAAAAAALLLASGIATAIPVNASGPTAGGTAVTIDGLHFVEVATSLSHSLGLTSDGTLYAWGSNQYGQLGDGTLTDSTLPVAVCASGSGSGCTPLTGITAVSAGGDHSLALTGNGGTALAWGSNSYGQLGDGTTTNRSLPVAVCASGSGSGCPPLTGITSVSAGGDHSLAISGMNQTALSWGHNVLGALGDGTNTSSTLPVTVCSSGSGVGCPALTGITAVSAGVNHSLAISGTNQTALAWGSNSYGQLGDGTNTNRSLPITVCASGSGVGCPALTGIAAVSAGVNHSLAISGTNQTALAWGWNFYGQLGDGTATRRSLPITVCASGSGAGCPALTGVTAVSAGWGHSLAISGTNETALAWGWNLYGQLGDGTTSNRSLPVAVCASGSGAGCPALTGISAISASAIHSLTLTVGGRTAFAWGYNASGQLGDGTTTNRSLAVLSANFVPTTLAFGTALGINSTVSNGQITATSPAAAAGTVALTGTANVFGGTTAATPGTVSWYAGSFTFVAPTPSQTQASTHASSPNGSSSAAANLAATGGDLAVPIGAAALALIAGTVLILRRTRITDS